MFEGVLKNFAEWLGEVYKDDIAKAKQWLADIAKYSQQVATQSAEALAKLGGQDSKLDRIEAKLDGMIKDRADQLEQLKPLVEALKEYGYAAGREIPIPAFLKSSTTGSDGDGGNAGSAPATGTGGDSDASPTRNPE